MNSDHLQKAEIDQLIRERDALREQVRQLTSLAAPELQLADNAPFGIAVVSAFKILYANKAAYRMFGYESDEALRGRDAISFVDPNEWDQLARLFEAVSLSRLRSPLHQETYGLRQDKSIFPLSVSIVGISWKSRPAFLCYLADTADKKNHEISRMKSLARRRILREAASIAVWEWNVAAGTLEMDDGLLASLNIFPRARPKALFRKMIAKVHAHDRSRLRRQIIDGVRCGFVEAGPFRYEDHHGHTHVATLHAQCVSDPKNTPCLMVGIVRDLSDEHAASQALLQAQNDAQCANLAKHRFITNISHELRTPLNGILGMLQLMGQEQGSDTFRRHLSMAMMSGKNLLQIINDILELSESNPEDAIQPETEFSLAELLITNCESFRKEAEDKRLKLTCAVDLPADAIYRGNAERVGHILRNLLSNSIKFTAKGHIELTASVIRDHLDVQRILLCVQDTGVGIPDQKLIEVFEPFTQADDSPSRLYQGAGLGLGLVRRHVSRLGGTLSVSSEEGQGTSICVSLDLIPCARSMPIPPRAQAITASSKILLAEDNLVNQVLAETVLRQIGYEVRPVQNGREVLQALEEDEFGCILMDIQMPEMSGIEATRRIRTSQKPYAQVPIIALTAHALQGDRERLLACGMNGYLAKPISISELKQLVAAIISPKDANNS